MSDTDLFKSIPKKAKHQNKIKGGDGVSKKNIAVIIISVVIIGVVILTYMNRSTFLPANGQQRSDLAADKNYSIKSVFERLRAKQKAFLSN